MDRRKGRGNQDSQKEIVEDARIAKMRKTKIGFQE